jgi:hypothetical protein
LNVVCIRHDGVGSFLKFFGCGFRHVVLITFSGKYNRENENKV